MSKAAREREVLKLHKEIANLTDAQQKWVYENVMEHLVLTSGKKAWCSVCGHKFDITDEYRKNFVEGKVVCPHCHREARLIESRKKTHRDSFYFQIVTTHKGWQVLRYFYAEYRCKAGEEVWFHEREVFQKWCKPGMPAVTIGANLCAFPYSCHCPYSLWGHWRVRKSDWYNEWMKVHVYPVKRILPEWKKVGVRVNDLKPTAAWVFSKVFTNPYTERLYKENRMDELEEACSCIENVQKWWPSIKVALRHGFKIESLSNYLDYLRCLNRLKMDTRNPKYIAPADFTAAEEEIRVKMQELYNREYRERQLRWEQEERERKERMELEAKEEGAKLEKRMTRWAGFVITDGKIDITPLMNIQDFIDEGNAMHHCVFTNEYWKDKDCLILTARKDGERVETIEIDLLNYSVAQSRGKYNQPTEYHDEIVGMLCDNMDRIKKIQRKRKVAEAAVA